MLQDVREELQTHNTLQHTRTTHTSVVKETTATRDAADINNIENILNNVTDQTHCENLLLHYGSLFNIIQIVHLVGPA